MLAGLDARVRQSGRDQREAALAHACMLALTQASNRHVPQLWAAPHLKRRYLEALIVFGRFCI